MSAYLITRFICGSAFVKSCFSDRNPAVMFVLMMTFLTRFELSLVLFAPGPCMQECGSCMQEALTFTMHYVLKTHVLKTFIVVVLEKLSDAVLAGVRTPPDPCYSSQNDPDHALLPQSPVSCAALK